MEISPETRLDFDIENDLNEVLRPFESESLPERTSGPFFLRLTSGPDKVEYYPTAGDLVLQLLLPKFDPASNDLTPMGSVPVVVIFSNRGQCISLPIWESSTPPQHVPYIELDGDLECVGTQPQGPLRLTRVLGSRLYALLTPVYATARSKIQWLFPKYQDLPVCPWLWPAEPFCRFSISPAKLRWYEWRVYYTLFPNLAPSHSPLFEVVSNEFRRGKFGCREYENVYKLIDMVCQLTLFWLAMEENVRNSWTENQTRLLGENAGKRIDPRIRSFDGEGYLEVLPNWQDVMLLPLPSKSPGLAVKDSDRQELEKAMNIFRRCIDMGLAIVDPDVLRESEKYLLRMPPQDEMPRRSPAVSRSRYDIDANGFVFLLHTGRVCL